MASFDIAIGKTLAKEGGAKVTDIAGDNGGLTKYGISQASYPTVDIRNLTEQQAKDIYKKDYWDRVRADEIISQVVAETVFDTAVNLGVGPTSKLVQEAVGVIADGIIGKGSLSAINQCSEKELVLKIALAKVRYYANICNKNREQNKFLLGWINRTLEAIK